MRHKSYTKTNQCEEDPTKKPKCRNEQPSKNASVKEETLVFPPSGQAKTSESDICEDYTSEDSQDGLASKDKTVRVKDEDTYSECIEVDRFELASDHVCHPTQYDQTNDASKCNTSRSREIPEDIRRRVIEAHKNGKGYKKISKELDLPLSTIRHIVCKWKKFSTVATLPRSGRPTKIGAKARRTILKHMTENPLVKAKDLQASLALDNIIVHESTIRRTLNKWFSHDFTLEEIIALQKE